MTLKYASLEITALIGCKVQCKYCPQDLLARRYVKHSDTTRMSLDAFKLCIDKVPPNVHIGFSGMVEPWLHPQCAEMVLYAAERGHPIRMFTTLVGMQLADFERIRHLDFSFFCVHLPDSLGNASIKVDERYLTLLERIFRHFGSAERGQRLDVSCHGPVHPEVLSRIPPNLFPGPYLQKLQDRMIDRAGNLDAPELAHRRHVGPLECILSGRDLNRNILLPNGAVLLCCMDYGQEVVLGNLQEMSYEDLFRSETFTKLQATLDGDGEILCRFCSNAVPLRRPYDFIDVRSVLNEPAAVNSPAL